MNLDSLERLCCDMFVLAMVIGASTDLGAIECSKQMRAQILIGNGEFDWVVPISNIW